MDLAVSEMPGREFFLGVAGILIRMNPRPE
jgi:hypothetical protein